MNIKFCALLITVLNCLILQASESSSSISSLSTSDTLPEKERSNQIIYFKKIQNIQIKKNLLMAISDTLSRSVQHENENIDTLRSAVSQFKASQLSYRMPSGYRLYHGFMNGDLVERIDREIDPKRFSVYDFCCKDRGDNSDFFCFKPSKPSNKVVLDYISTLQQQVDYQVILLNRSHEIMMQRVVTKDVEVDKKGQIIALSLKYSKAVPQSLMMESRDPLQIFKDTNN